MRVLNYIDPSVDDPKALALLTRHLLRAGAVHNLYLLNRAAKRGRPLPNIYSARADVQWEREPWAGRLEEFADVLTVLRRGWGDCDDLAMWLVALYQQKGIPADFKISWKVNPKTGEVKMFHVEVRVRPKWDPILKQVTGRTEDPSKKLGM